MNRNVEIDIAKLLNADEHIETIEVTTTEVRAFVAGEELDMDDMDTSLDLAQAVVFSKEKEAAYVIIKIVRGEEEPEHVG